MLTALFAGLALVLAVLGLYGVLAYSVRQRTREIGIRIALGARRGEVAGMVVRQGLRVTAAGVALGAAGSLVLERVLASLVFHTQPTEPAVLAATAAALLLAGTAAALVPALRAMGVAPRVALSDD